MTFWDPKQLETPLNKGSFRITSVVETVSSRNGNCQFPPWKLTVTKLDDATIDGQWGGHLLTLYVLSLTRMTINDPWMTVNKNFMLNFRTFILIESWKGWMLRLPAFCWWASSPLENMQPHHQSRWDFTLTERKTVKTSCARKSNLIWLYGFYCFL